MDLDEYINKMKEIHKKLLNFIENEDNEEENFQNLENNKKNFQLEYKRQEFKSFLYLVSRIASNHYRGPNFINKIERILLIVKDFITKTLKFSSFSNIVK